MKRYDTIVFDLDGTLLDTLEDLADAVNFALLELGLGERSLEEIRQFVGNGVRTLMERAVPGGASNSRFEKAFALFQERYAAHSADKTRPYEGVLPLLRELKERGYAMAVVSNKGDAAVKELAPRYFGDLLDAAVGEREDRPRKPAPDGVFAALKELGKGPERALFVGDSEVDAQTAMNAALPLVAVLWGFRDEACLRKQGATRFARHPRDILAFLEEDTE